MGRIKQLYPLVRDSKVLIFALDTDNNPWCMKVTDQKMGDWFRLPDLPSKNPKIKSEKDPREGFEELWQAYPRHTARLAAIKSFNRIDPKFDSIILKAVEESKGTRQWKEGAIPHLSTYLNQKRWEDELAPSTESYLDRKLKEL